MLSRASERAMRPSAFSLFLFQLANVVVFSSVTFFFLVVLCVTLCLNTSVKGFHFVAEKPLDNNTNATFRMMVLKFFFFSLLVFFLGSVTELGYWNLRLWQFSTVHFFFSHSFKQTYNGINEPHQFSSKIDDASEKGPQKKRKTRIFKRWFAFSSGRCGCGCVCVCGANKTNASLMLVKHQCGYAGLNVSARKC